MISVTLEGEFDGWEATARADFPAGMLADLASGDIGRIIGVLGEIVTEHNFPRTDGTLAESMSEVDPYDGLIAVASELFEQMGKLPNRSRRNS